MIWKNKTTEKYHNMWDTAFALLPVRVGDYTVWLETYEYSRTYPEVYGITWPNSPGVTTTWYAYRLQNGYKALCREELIEGSTFFGGPEITRHWTSI